MTSSGAGAPIYCPRDVRPVLVLGANGYLGSHVCEALSRVRPSGRPWVGVARQLPPDLERTGESWYRLDLATAPVSEYRRLLSSVRPAAVINCAGATGGSNSELRTANIHIVRKLLTALACHPTVRLVHFGSAAEYGLQPSHAGVTETADPRPITPYGMTKLAATRAVTSAIAEKRVDATVLRVFNPVGARAPITCLPGWAAQAMRRAISESRPSITLGSLEAHRDFVAADDVATAAVLCLDTPDLPPVVNVARGVAMSTGALVTLLEGVAGFTGEIVEAGRGSPRSPWVPWQQADINLMRRHLGWAPNTPIASAVAALWAATA